MNEPTLQDACALWKSGNWLFDSIDPECGHILLWNWIYIAIVIVIFYFVFKKKKNWKKIILAILLGYVGWLIIRTCMILPFIKPGRFTGTDAVDYLETLATHPWLIFFT